MSYAQNNEDVALLAHFGDQTDGMFLEIGAFHPTNLSNTRALIERGWSGVMVEMSPYALVDLVEAYKAAPRIRIVAGAVTVAASPPAKSWLVPKDEATDGAITTTEDWHREKWAGYLASRNRAHIPFVAATISMAELMDMLPPRVDLVSIDTEGTSADLALAFDYNRFGVRAAVIEHDSNPALGQLLPLGFRVAESNGENLVLLR
jgi:hypothetical protein